MKTLKYMTCRPGALSPRRHATALLKIGPVLFLLAVAILIINDWYLKGAFANSVTGKLSDFAGLFALPWFMTCFFPRYKMSIHFSTALLFVAWKSEFAEAGINLINAANIPVHRTADPTDNIALISVLASYFTPAPAFQSLKYRLVANLIFVISGVALIATTMPPAQLRKYTNINKEYKFRISKRELVSRLNALQLKEIAKLSRWSGGQINFDQEKNTFHYNNSPDTLGLILDYSRITDVDTIAYKTSLASILILGNDSLSSLKLISIYRHVSAFREKDFREKAISVFERKVIKKLKHPKPN